jgi:hypothetical protein
LNTPLATPVRYAGTLLSRTAISGGITSGPARPTRTITAARAGTGVADGRPARITSPAVIETSPAVMRTFAPSFSAMRALSGVSAAPVSIIGKNAAPVPSGDRPRSCCRYRLITNGRP